MASKSTGLKYRFGSSRKPTGTHSFYSYAARLDIHLEPVNQPIAGDLIRQISGRHFTPAIKIPL
jgi:hypothetical protein